MGQRPAGRKCRPRHDADAGCRNPLAEAIPNCPTRRQGVLLRPCQLVQILVIAGQAVLQKPVGFRAVHGLQRGALLRECGVKFVVAAALLLGAFDQSAQPVGGFEQPVLLCRQDAAIHAGGQLCSQFCGQKPCHGAHAFGLQRLVGVPQRRGVVFDRRGHIPGNDLRRIVVQRRHRHHLGAAGRAGVVLGDETQQMRQQRGVTGMLAEGFRPGGVHQAPPGNVLHARQQGAEGIQHNNTPPFLHHTRPACGCQALFSCPPPCYTTR